MNLINKIITGTEIYKNLYSQYKELEKTIKRITKIREKYKNGVQDIKNILKGYSQKNKKELLECITEISKICKKIGE